MLIVSVLSFVYFVTVKTDRIKKMFLVAGCALSGLALIYAVTFTINDLVKVLGEYDYYEYPYYFILVSYAIATALPMVVFFSLSKKEEPQEEPKEEPKQIEEQPEEKK